MREVIRYPESIDCDFHTGRINQSSRVYPGYALMSGSNPSNSIDRVVNPIVVPAQSRKILSVRLMLRGREGTTSNSLQFTFCVMDCNTGVIVTQLPTAPALLDPLDLNLFPDLIWQTVYQASSPGAAPVINVNEFLGVVFTGVAGVWAQGSNDFRVYALMEALLES